MQIIITKSASGVTKSSASFLPKKKNCCVPVLFFWHSYRVKSTAIGCNLSSVFFDDQGWSSAGAADGSPFLLPLLSPKLKITLRKPA
jgi:hypothetical protein